MSFGAVLGGGIGVGIPRLELLVISGISGIGSFLGLLAAGDARLGRIIRVDGDCAESGGSAHASRKRVASLAKTSGVSTIRTLLMPAPIPSSMIFRRRNVRVPEVSGNQAVALRYPAHECKGHTSTRPRVG